MSLENLHAVNSPSKWAMITNVFCYCRRHFGLHSWSYSILNSDLLTGLKINSSIQSWTINFLIWFFAITWPNFVFANNSELFFQSLNSTHLEVWTQKKSTGLQSKTWPLHQMGLSWIPSLDFEPSGENCDIDQFRTQLQKSSNTLEVFQEVWKRCESSWRKNTLGPLAHSLEVLTTDFEPLNHPSARIVQWTLPDLTKIRGLLFMKGPVKKPLVIIRPGIFSHLKSTVAERFLMMQLFEEGAFHVLLIPSASGNDFIEDNHFFGFGGYVEAMHNHHLLKYLHEPNEPISQYINKIHFVGISLGSHGIWLNNLIHQQEPYPLLDRTLLFCPAVDLKQTYASHHQNLLTHLAVNTWFSMRLSPMRNELRVPDGTSVVDYVNLQLGKDNLKSAPWVLPSPHPPSSAQSFWDYNDYWSWMPAYDFTNTFVVWNQLDPVVPPAVNVEKMLSNLSHSKSHFLSLPRGLHCSLPASYQWKPLSFMTHAFLNTGENNTSGANWIYQKHTSYKIKTIRLRRVSTKNQVILGHWQIEFQNKLLGIESLETEIPLKLSQFAWYQNEFNDELLQSIKREFQSRFTWTQDQDHVTLQLNPL